MRAALPSIADFPIPRDIAPGPGWSAQMVEMAGHIGAYETLMLCDKLGGQEFYVPVDPAQSPFLPLLGARKAKALTWVYRQCRITIPKADYAIRRARRAGIVAAARAGMMTVSDAARIMGVRRPYASKLVHATDEGIAAAPVSLRKGVDPRQLDMFG